MRQQKTIFLSVLEIFGYLSLIIFLVCFCSFCEKSQKITPVDEILQSPKKFIDKEVVIEGKVFALIRNRNQMLVAYYFGDQMAKSIIVVTKQKEKLDTGTKLRVKGIVKVKSKGKPSLVEIERTRI